MENFPEDILSNIFIRLLVKQLAQMRCVSKSWNALLYKPSLIKCHLNRSIQNNKKDGIFFVFCRSFSFASKPFTSHPYQSPHQELTNILKLPSVTPHSYYSRGKVIGSVNGLICFKYRSNHGSEAIYIWNPSLSTMLTLPPHYMPAHSIEQFIRFGFDPKTDDYKVVKIIRRHSTSTNTDKDLEWLPVEVFTMRKGSWKLTFQTFPSHLKNIVGFDDLCVDGHDGHLHWAAETSLGLNHADTIIAYDLGAETFCLIPLPDSITGGNVNYSSINLGVLDGKLSVISRVVPNGVSEVWVMDKYGEAESWVKHLVLPRFSGYLYPYGFTSHNEFFFRVEGRGHALHNALHDPVAAKTKIFKFGKEDKLKVVDYVDSLVWITPAEQRKWSCCGMSQFQMWRHFPIFIICAFEISLFVSRRRFQIGY